MQRKKWFSFALAFCMVLSMIPASMISVSAAPSGDPSPAPITLELDQPVTLSLSPNQEIPLRFTAPEAGQYAVYYPLQSPISLSSVEYKPMSTEYHSQENYAINFSMSSQEVLNLSAKRYMGGESATVPICITKVPQASGLAISESEVTLNIGDTHNLDTYITPFPAFEAITWESSAPEVAHISNQAGQHNYISAKSPGTAVITAKSESGMTATCSVTVKTPTKIDFDTPNKITVPAGGSVLTAFDVTEAGWYYVESSRDPNAVHLSRLAGTSTSVSGPPVHINNHKEYIHMDGAGTIGASIYNCASVDVSVTIQPYKAPLPQAIIPNSTEVYVTEGEQVCVDYSFSPVNSYMPTDGITITSSNPDVVDLVEHFDTSPEFIAHKAGTADITFQAGKISTVVHFTVIKSGSYPKLEVGTTTSITLQPGKSSCYKFTAPETGYYMMLTDVPIHVDRMYSMNSGKKHPFPVEAGVSQILTLQNPSSNPITVNVRLGKTVEPTALILPKTAWGKVGGILKTEVDFEPEFGYPSDYDFLQYADNFDPSNAGFLGGAASDINWREDWILKPGTFDITVTSKTGLSATTTVTACMCSNLTEVKEQAATCTKEGILHHWVCEDCGHFYADAYGSKILDSVSVPMLPHNLSEIAGQPATCTKEGVLHHWVCKDCGQLFADANASKALNTAAIPTVPHKLSAVAQKDPTYTENGAKAHWICESCKKQFADEKGSVLITDSASLAIPKLVEISEEKAKISDSAVDKSMETAEPNQNITLDLSDVPEEISSVVFSKDSMQKIAEKKTGITLQLPQAVVSLDSKVITAAVKKGVSDLAIQITVKKEATLTSKQTAAMADTKALSFISADLISGDNAIHDFQGGSASISILFTPETGKAGADYSVCYLAEDGAIEVMPTQFKDGILTFTAGHFSTYFIAETSSVTTSPKADATTPATGDMFSPMIVFAIAIIACSTCGVLLRFKKHTN